MPLFAAADSRSGGRLVFESINRFRIFGYCFLVWRRFASQSPRRYAMPGTDPRIAFLNQMVERLEASGLPTDAKRAVGRYLRSRRRHSNRGARRAPLPAQVDADEGAACPAVVERTLDPFVQEPEALLGDMHPQHPSDADRRAHATRALRIKRLDLGLQLAPRRHRLDFGGEAVAPRLPLLGGILQLGTARLRRMHSRLAPTAAYISRESLRRYRDERMN